MQDGAKTILHIDDDTLLRAALGTVLKASGYTVLSAGSGQEGVDIAMRQHPRVIIVDFEMPDMDGTAVVKTIRAAGEWGAQVPIVFATNKYDLAAVNELAALGVTDYVIKSDAGIAGIERLVAKYV